MLQRLMLGWLVNNELDKTWKAVDVTCFSRAPLTLWGRDYAGQTSLGGLPILGRDFNRSLPKCHLFPVLLFCFWRDSLQWAMASSFTRFLDHTQRRTTFGRTSLDEWSARRRVIHLTTHNTHNGQTSMTPGGIRTHNLSRLATVEPRLRPRGQWDRLPVL